MLSPCSPTNFSTPFRADPVPNAPVHYEKRFWERLCANGCCFFDVPQPSNDSLWFFFRAPYSSTSPFKIDTRELLPIIFRIGNRTVFFFFEKKWCFFFDFLTIWWVKMSKVQAQNTIKIMVFRKKIEKIENFKKSLSWPKIFRFGFPACVARIFR